MVDPVVGASVVGGLFAGKDLINKVLGPSADYIGERGRDLVEKADENLGKILSAAARKLGPKINDQGSVESSHIARSMAGGSLL